MNTLPPWHPHPYQMRMKMNFAFIEKQKLYFGIGFHGLFFTCSKRSLTSAKPSLSRLCARVCLGRLKTSPSSFIIWRTRDSLKRIFNSQAMCARIRVIVQTVNGYPIFFGLVFIASTRRLRYSAVATIGLPSRCLS